MLRLRLAMNPRDTDTDRLDVLLRARDASGRTTAQRVRGAGVERPLLGGAGAFSTGDPSGYLDLALHGARVAITGAETRRLTSLELVLGGSGSMQLVEVVATHR